MRTPTERRTQFVGLVTMPTDFVSDVEVKPSAYDLSEYEYTHKQRRRNQREGHTDDRSASLRLIAAIR